MVSCQPSPEERSIAKVVDRILEVGAVAGAVTLRGPAQGMV
jgi:hypothetical protein